MLERNIVVISSALVLSDRAVMKCQLLVNPEIGRVLSLCGQKQIHRRFQRGGQFGLIITGLQCSNGQRFRRPWGNPLQFFGNFFHTVQVLVGIAVAVIELQNV